MPSSDPTPASHRVTTENRSDDSFDEVSVHREKADGGAEVPEAPSDPDDEAADDLDTQQPLNPA